MEETRRALSFHDAADSEEVCEEALRCEASSVSHHIQSMSSILLLSRIWVALMSSDFEAEAVDRSTYRGSLGGSALAGAERARGPRSCPAQHCEVANGLST